MQCKSFTDFMSEYESYKKILWNYRNTKEQFYDLSFHPQRRVHESEVSFDDSQIEWLRIDEIYKSPLFAEDLINIDYVQQGTLGDCSFICAVSRLAREPKLIYDLFDHTADTILGPITNSINIECGAVVIFFHAFGRETPVLIDTLIPFNKNTLLPIFSRPSNRKVSPWFCLVEKAYAKLQGSYSNIVGVSFVDANYHLFGYEQLHFSFSQLKRKTPFEKIVKHFKRGAVMDTSINLKKIRMKEEDLKRVGLLPSHSYLIEKAVEYKGMRLICLRNPWGIFEWNGDWSNKSHLWTAEIKNALGISKKFEEGTFWMIEKDYVRYFTDINVSWPIPSDWHSKSFTTEMWNSENDGFEPEMPEAKLDELPNFVFQITDNISDTENVPIYFLIERRSYLQSGAELIDQDPSIYYLILAESFGKKLRHEVLLRSNRSLILNAGIINGFKILFAKNKEMITICLHRALKCNYEEECTVRICCKYNFKLYNIDSPKELIPDNNTGRAVFSNMSLVHSLSHLPSYRPKMAEKKEPETSTNDNFTDAEIEKRIENFKKIVDILKKEKDGVQKKLNMLISLSMLAQNELKSLVLKVETSEYEVGILAAVVNEIEQKRNSLEKLENVIGSLLTENDDKDKQIESVNRLIEQLINKQKK